jgi:hypothetical protein
LLLTNGCQGQTEKQSNSILDWHFSAPAIPQVQDLCDFSLDPGPADDIMAIMSKTCPTKRGFPLPKQALKPTSYQAK